MCQASIGMKKVILRPGVRTFDCTYPLPSTASTRGSYGESWYVLCGQLSLSIRLYYRYLAKYHGRGKLEKAQFTVENCRAHFHWWKS
jgi:hypothetical protein